MQILLFRKIDLRNHHLLDSKPYVIEDLVMSDRLSFSYFFMFYHLNHHLFE